MPGNRQPHPLGLLIAALATRGPVIMVRDDTIEHRRGKRSTAEVIDRDPVRSSDSHIVGASGLRRMSLILMAPTSGRGASGRCRS